MESMMKQKEEDGPEGKMPPFPPMVIKVFTELKEGVQMLEEKLKKMGGMDDGLEAGSLIRKHLVDLYYEVNGEMGAFDYLNMAMEYMSKIKSMNTDDMRSNKARITFKTLHDKMSSVEKLLSESEDGERVRPMIKYMMESMQGLWNHMTGGPILANSSPRDFIEKFMKNAMEMKAKMMDSIPPEEMIEKAREMMGKLREMVKDGDMGNDKAREMFGQIHQKVVMMKSKMGNSPVAREMMEKLSGAMSQLWNHMSGGPLGKAKERPEELMENMRGMMLQLRARMREEKNKPPKPEERPPTNYDDKKEGDMMGVLQGMGKQIEDMMGMMRPQQDERRQLPPRQEGRPGDIMDMLKKMDELMSSVRGKMFGEKSKDDGYGNGGGYGKDDGNGGGYGMGGGKENGGGYGMGGGNGGGYGMGGGKGNGAGYGNGDGFGCQRDYRPQPPQGNQDMMEKLDEMGKKLKELIGQMGKSKDNDEKKDDYKKEDGYGNMDDKKPDNKDKPMEWIMGFKNDKDDEDEKDDKCPDEKEFWRELLPKHEQKKWMLHEKGFVGPTKTMSKPEMEHPPKQENAGPVGPEGEQPPPNRPPQGRPSDAGAPAPARRK